MFFTRSGTSVRGSGRFYSCPLVLHSSRFIAVLSRDAELSVMLVGLDRCSSVGDAPTEVEEALLEFGGGSP